MTKKPNNIIGILIVILIITIVLGAYIYSFTKSGNNSKYFDSNDSTALTKIYEKLIELSEENYPETPEQVVELYVSGYKLLYGDKLKDTYIVPTIIEKQRVLFSDELLLKNPIDEQIDNVLEAIENLKENKIKIISNSVNSLVYVWGNDNAVYVKVSTQDSNFQLYYYLYYLEKSVDGKWRIMGWYNTDENYNIN